MPEPHKASLKDALKAELDMALSLRPDLQLVKAIVRAVGETGNQGRTGDEPRPRRQGGVPARACGFRRERG